MDGTEGIKAFLKLKDFSNEINVTREHVEYTCSTINEAIDSYRGEILDIRNEEENPYTKLIEIIRQERDIQEFKDLIEEVVSYLEKYYQ